jgi:hypothetical protein
MKCVMAAIIAVLVNGSSKKVIVYFHTLHYTYTSMLCIFLRVCIENNILLTLVQENYL